MLSRVCRVCHAEKSIEMFPVRDRERGTFRTECKVCIKELKSEWQTAYNKAYHQANKEKMSLRNKAYHEANRDRLLPVMRERNLSRYHSDQGYQHRVLSACAKRRAPSEKFIPSWSDPVSVEAVYAYAAALRRIGVDAEVDHIVPIKSKLVCGLHVHENLRVITRSENRKKKNVRWPDDMPYAQTPFSLPI